MRFKRLWESHPEVPTDHKIDLEWTIMTIMDYMERHERASTGRGAGCGLCFNHGILTGY